MWLQVYNLFSNGSEREGKGKNKANVVKCELGDLDEEYIGAICTSLTTFL